jgi:AcrR family transcriptional regulator
MASGLRERNKARRAQQILDVTRELIREDPDRTPTVDEIAARAEVAPATVFNLVGPRERIWAALADEAIAEAEARLAVRPDHGDPHQRARLIVTTTLDVLLADASVYRRVLAHWSESGRLLDRDPTGDLRDCLVAARDAGDLDARVDVGMLARMVATSCTGAMHQWAAGLIGERSLRRRCTAAVDLVFAAGAASQKARARYVAALSRR